DRSRRAADIQRMSKPIAKSRLTISRLKAVLVRARHEGHQARLEMRLANRAVLRGLLDRDDAAALAGREREQIARANARRATEIIAACLAELAELNAVPPAPDPAHLASLPPRLLAAVAEALTMERA